MLAEQPVELVHRPLLQPKLNRVAEPGPSFEDTVPCDTAVLMVLLDSHDRLLAVQRDPVRCGHVLEQGAVQHVGLLAVAAPTELHDRSVGQRGSSKHGEEQRLEAFAIHADRLTGPRECQQVSARRELRVQRPLRFKRVDLRPQGFLLVFVLRVAQTDGGVCPVRAANSAT